MPLTESELTEADAAKIIQKAWRSHVDKQVFRFYKDLIGFHTKMMANELAVKSKNKQNVSQNPDLSEKTIQKSSLVTATSKQCAATILKLISPKEAQLMDDAAGTHIRFRLASPAVKNGGKVSKFGQFPPAVFYKIYTHRPIVDLCATAPRDYTLPANKVTLPKQQFNFQPENFVSSGIFPGAGQNGTTGHQVNFLQNPTSNWYKRYENNEWRSISDSLLLSSIRVITDISNNSSAKKNQNFKPTITQRRLKRNNDKKRKRIDWLAKIYFQDRHKNDEELVLKEAIEDLYVISKENQIREVNPWAYCTNIDDEIGDDDIQALVEWTDCLDYEDYSNYWSHLGTAGFPSVDVLGVPKTTRNVLKEKAQLATEEDSNENSNTNSLENKSYNTPRSPQNDHPNPSKLLNITSDSNSEVPEDDQAIEDYWTLDKLEMMSRPVSGRITVRK